MADRDEYATGPVSGPRLRMDAENFPARAKKVDAAAAALEKTAAVLAKIAALPEPYRAMGERLHAVIVRSAPALQPTVWYGMPGYAKDGKTVCFFRADKNYMTFGFTQEANLAPDYGAPHQLIESAWFLTALDDATETRLSDILRKAALGWLRSVDSDNERKTE